MVSVVRTSTLVSGVALLLSVPIVHPNDSKFAKYPPEDVLRAATNLRGTRPTDVMALLRLGIDNWSEEHRESIVEACNELGSLILYHTPEQLEELYPPRCLNFQTHYDPLNREALPIFKVAPILTPNVQNGVVELEYTVTVEGKVEDVVVTSSTHRALNKRSIAAAKKGRYKPKLVNGVPQASRVEMRIRLNPGDEEE